MRRTASRLVPMAVLVMALAACSTGAPAASAQDPTASAEYRALEQQLAAVTAERDQMTADARAAAGRYEKAKATQAKLRSIIEDPAAFGTRSEVLAALKEMAVPGLLSVDEVFGAVDWLAGWNYTLFNNTDAKINTWRSWLSDDGSVGGSLWTWSGIARNGEPFDLQGAETSRFNEDGLVTESVMFYAYPDEEVTRRFNEGN
jgi:hypothetical protein